VDRYLQVMGKNECVCVVIVREMVCRSWHFVVPSTAYLELNSATLKLHFIEQIFTGKCLVPVFKNEYNSNTSLI
jgi:hypothetical protein